MDRLTWKDNRFVQMNRLVLDKNENCSESVKTLTKKFLSCLDIDSIIRYPNLKKAYESLNIFNIDPDTVLFTNGAEGAIRSIFDHGTELKSVSFPTPTFGMIPVLAQIVGLTPIPVPYDETFILDIDKLVSGDIVYLANPDNPTGTILDLEVLKKICDSGKVVVLDETYHGFSSVGALSLISTYKNLYVVKSFSKMLAGAGIRLGMVVSNKENIQKLMEEKPSYEISGIACEYVDFVARHQDDFLTITDDIIQAKALIEERLASNAFLVRKTHANFILVGYTEQLYKQISVVADVKIVTIAGGQFIKITSPDSITAKRLIKSGVFGV